jgi:hypothetical protein
LKRLLLLLALFVVAPASADPLFAAGGTWTDWFYTGTSNCELGGESDSTVTTINNYSNTSPIDIQFSETTAGSHTSGFVCSIPTFLWMHYSWTNGGGTVFYDPAAVATMYYSNTPLVNGFNVPDSVVVIGTELSLGYVARFYNYHLLNGVPTYSFIFYRPCCSVPLFAGGPPYDIEVPFRRGR